MSDPYLILGVAPDADDATIQAAYLAAVKACPPEHDPQRFEAVRRAYEAIRTRKDRLAQTLFDAEPLTLSNLLERAAPTGEPGRPGADLFAAVLRGER